MDFSFSPEAVALRDEIRAFLEVLVTDEVRHAALENGTDYDPAVYQAMADAGYVGMSIPRELGGMGRSYTELAIFLEEAARVDMPHGIISLYMLTSGFAVSAILRLGDDAQKRAYLPGIASGDFRFAQGFTEPDAGSDLAAAQFRCRVDGDELVLNGQKIYNQAHNCTHMTTVTRSEPDAPKHRGISLVILDLRLPGVELTPLYTIRGHRVNIVTCTDVRVPRSCLLGELNRGWYALMSVIDMERSNVDRVAMVEHMLTKVVEYVKSGEKLEGVPLESTPAVRDAIADAFVDIHVARLMSYEVRWLQESGLDASARVSVAKAHQGDMIGRTVNLLMNVLGPRAAVEWINAPEAGKRLSIGEGLLVRMYKDAKIWTIAGGTREIQRNIIAQRVLGMPHD